MSRTAGVTIRLPVCVSLSFSLKRARRARSALRSGASRRVADSSSSPPPYISASLGHVARALGPHRPPSRYRGTRLHIHAHALLDFATEARCAAVAVSLYTRINLSKRTSGEAASSRLKSACARTYTRATRAFVHAAEAN